MTTLGHKPVVGLKSRRGNCCVEFTCPPHKPVQDAWVFKEVVCLLFCFVVNLTEARVVREKELQLRKYLYQIAIGKSVGHFL